MPIRVLFICFFFFNDTATTEIYTLSLHDALPISRLSGARFPQRLRHRGCCPTRSEEHTSELQSRVDISYAVFCLKKKKMKYYNAPPCDIQLGPHLPWRWVA